MGKDITPNKAVARQFDLEPTLKINGTHAVIDSVYFGKDAKYRAREIGTFWVKSFGPKIKEIENRKEEGAKFAVRRYLR